MAELVLLIFVMGVLFAGYFVSRMFDESLKVLAVWITVAVFIAIGLGVYASRKVDEAEEGWLQPYQQLDEEY